MRATNKMVQNRYGGLRRFFEAMHEQSDNTAATPQSRSRSSLERFFAEVAQFRSIIAAPREPKVIEVQVNSIRLTSFLDYFGPLSKRLQKRGEFISVWELSGLKRNELRNALVLAWLFSPNQTHGRGSAIFQAFIHRLVELAEHHQETFPLPTQIIGSYSSLRKRILSAT
jgi:hypothetical protein